MLVHAVLQTGESGSVRAGLALENDRAAVRQDEPVPSEQHAGLTGGDLTVILADQPSPLRDQQAAPRGAVIDVRRHLRGDLAGQVRTDAGDERGRDNATGLHDVWRCRRRQPLDGARGI